MSDVSLVQRDRDGNQSAAKRLYRRYAECLRRMAWLKCSPSLRRRLDTDDIIQSVFRRFFAAAQKGNYQVPAGADLWNLLLVITLNKIRTAEDFHRTAKRDIRRTVGVDGDEIGASRNESVSSFSRLPSTKPSSNYPRISAQAVRLRMEGYDVTEIAERLARSKRTVERILQEARNALSKHIGEPLT